MQIPDDSNMIFAQKVKYRMKMIGKIEMYITAFSKSLKGTKAVECNKMHTGRRRAVRLTFNFTLTILIVLMLFSEACTKEEIIILDPPAEEPIPQNATESLILEMRKKYQTNIIYRWDRRYTNSDAKVSPAKFELVKPYLQIIQDFWINPFDNQVPSFMRNHIPVEIILVGSTIRYHEGEEQGFNAAGQAISYSRILLAGVNDYDLADTFWLAQQILTMQHEFAHTLDRKYGRPKGFDDISKGLYAGSTSFTQFSLETARERGFWVPYGMSNEAEDFATVVEAFFELPKDELLAEVGDNKLLKEKYDKVYNYYLGMGIDLHEVQKSIDDNFNLISSSY
jgi:substrate import-associated zinc metallohydrolase lipoprotein